MPDLQGATAAAREDSVWLLWVDTLCAGVTKLTSLKLPILSEIITPEAIDKLVEVELLDRLWVLGVTVSV